MGFSLSNKIVPGIMFYFGIMLVLYSWSWFRDTQNVPLASLFDPVTVLFLIIGLVLLLGSLLLFRNAWKDDIQNF